MKHSLLPRLASPDGGGPLTLTINHEERGEIWDGCLTDRLGNLYPIEQGIPRLLTTSLLDAQKTEMAARDAQVKDYDRMAFLNGLSKVEIPLTRRALGAQPSDRLLEAGCGTGRMSRILAGGVKELVAIDFSWESLRVNQRKLRASGIQNVHLVQADLCHLPFTVGAFDRVVSCQVLEHVPGEAHRSAAVGELGRVVKPQGTLALSAYKHSLLTRLFARKEGAHDGGIPYIRFSKPELRAVLGTAFAVQSITGILVYIYLARCVKT